MKKQEWNEGLNHLDPALVEEYVLQKESLKKKSEKKKKWRPIASVAACFALTVGVVIALPMLAKTVPIGQYSSDDPSSRPSEISFPEVPVWEDAQYTAEEIATFFGAMHYEGGATNFYREIYVNDEKYLYVDSLPAVEYLGIYQYNREGTELNNSELEAFIERILPGISNAVGIAVPQYAIKEKEDYGSRNSLRAEIDESDHSWSFSQDLVREQFFLYRGFNNGKQIALNGEILKIDQNLSDKEIIVSLQPVKNKLFEIFGVSFPDVKIHRWFSYAEQGADQVTVYFYNAKDPVNSIHGLNTLDSDYIAIHFQAFEDFPEENADGTLSAQYVRYLRRRTPSETQYVLIGSEKRISLEEAEALLYNGYVFGGHSCKLCMAEQEKVSFVGYDYVDLEYVCDYETGLPNIEIPFYAFYKKIGTAPNGKLIYAKTYVPAIPVSGYTEYFEKQKENHGK